MTSLLDIRPQAIKVQIGDAEIECQGITADGVAQLMGRFPGLRGLLFPDGQRQGGEELSDPLALIHAAPETIAAIIAAGTGHPGNKEHEKAASKLPIEPQIDLLTAILRLTLPGGFVPFVEKITAIFGGVGGSLPALPSGEELPSNGNSLDAKALDTASPSRSTA